MGKIVGKPIDFRAIATIVDISETSTVVKPTVMIIVATGAFT